MRPGQGAQRALENMVVIVRKSGQLGNRLLVFAHFIANAIEHGYRIANPSFHDFAGYFVGTRDDFFVRYPVRPTSLTNRSLQSAYWKLLTRAVPLLKPLPKAGLGLKVLDVTAKNYERPFFDMSDPSFQQLVRESRALIVRDGWLFRDFGSLVRHAEVVRGVFEPVEAHANRIANVIDAARRDCDLLVGVHIRHGDYARWKGGRYFYAAADYARLITRLRDSVPGQRVRFLVCSDAPQDLATFAGLDAVPGPNHQLEDMYAFAACDYVMGPPSTYTLWASFYGSVPLYYVEDIEAPVTLADFNPRPWT
jgi:hypothetical protein